MKKNLCRIALVFTFVFAFMLTRVQVGGNKIYMGQGGTSVTNKTDAVVFNTIGEAYSIQTQTKEDWEIESVR